MSSDASNSSTAAQRLALLEAAVWRTDRAALPVFPRIVRRIIKEQTNLPGLTLFTPHRKGALSSRAELLRLVDLDELELTEADAADLPEQVFLLARPDDDELPRMTDAELLLRYWRLLFHMRVHAVLESSIESGRLTQVDLRRRIHKVGEAEFDEITAVLRHERMLLSPDNRGATFVEFAAVFLELWYFSPHWLPAYFPSLDDSHRITKLLSDLLDADALFIATRPEGSPLPSRPALDTAVELPQPPERLVSGSNGIWVQQRIVRAATRAGEKGNDVRAALLFTSSFRLLDQGANSNSSKGVAPESNEALDRLAIRLQRALELSVDEKAEYRDAVGKLVERATLEYWNSDARLLYDLQTTCDAFERDRYAVDIWGWLFSGFQRPIKRPLPNQREVQMSRSLRTATKRLPAARLTADERQRWTERLRAAAHTAEVQLRRRIRPKIALALDSVGLTPENVPERVSWNGIVDELCDAVVERGFFTIAHVRDALSRSSVKLGDLSGLPELLSGDKLLQADRGLASALDGVYRPAEFYLRWLQRISSLAFGTCSGRFATKHLAIPFGAAYMLIAFLDHSVVGPAARLLSSAPEPASVSGVAPQQLDPDPERKDVAKPLEGEEPIAPVDVIAVEKPAAPDGGVKAANRAAENAQGEVENDVDQDAVAEHKAKAESAAVVPSASDNAAAVETAVKEASHSHLEYRVQIGPDSFPISIPATSLLFGLFLYFLMHKPPFRRLVWNLLNTLYRVLRVMAIDAPRWLIRLEPIRLVLESAPVQFVRRCVLSPLVITAFFWCGPSVWHGTPLPPLRTAAVLFAIVAACTNSRLGRDIEELTFEYAGKVWNELRVRLFVAAIEAVVDFFRWVKDGFEKVLYTVDEWLRFRSGESRSKLALKAVLSGAWAMVAFGLTFLWTLFIEPQIHPLKHFPVVTVSHKLLLPLIPVFAQPLYTQVGLTRNKAYLYVTGVIWLIPGIFGFLVWELKENWRLYRANRRTELEPIIVGSHGETIYRLLTPGFHSGTLPTVFGRRRRAERTADPRKRLRLLLRYEQQLHHLEESVRRFIERQFVVQLDESAEWTAGQVQVGHIVLASNAISIELLCPQVGEPAWIEFQDQSGWIVSRLRSPGWMREALPGESLRALRQAVLGLYKLGGVDLVREQIATLLPADVETYDIARESLVVWPGRYYEHDVSYDFEQKPIIRARPRAIARRFSLPDLPATKLLYSLTPLSWGDWVNSWANSSEGRSMAPNGVAESRPQKILFIDWTVLPIEPRPAATAGRPGSITGDSTAAISPHARPETG